MYWALIVLVVCSLQMVFLVWKEYKRPNKAWLWVRIITSVLAVTCLACLAFPLTVRSKQSVSGSDVILLTKGYSDDLVQQVIEKHQIGKIYTGDKTIKAFNALYQIGRAHV